MKEGENSTDHQLVERAIQGEREAFDQLTTRHISKMYRIARRLGLQAEDAADVVQDAFLAAWRSLERFNFSYQFSTWITRILVNRVSNRRRGLQRLKRYFIASATAPPKGLKIENAPGVPAPHEDVERAERKRLLMQEIEKLPEQQKTVLVLFELEDYKIREIASVLNISEGTVSSRLHHARLQLRKRLEKILKE